MTWLDTYKMRLPFGSELRAELVLFGFVAAIVLCGGSANADFTFGAPQDLGLGNGGYISVSADELELYFNSNRAGGLGNQDIWVSTRQSIDDPWGPPTNLQTVNSPYSEGFPCISRDGLTLYFSDFFYGPDRPGGLGQHDLWFSTRASRNDPWGAPVNMGAPFNTSDWEVSPTLSHDELTFIFASILPSMATYDLRMCTRPSVQEAWGPSVNMGPRVNSGSHDCYGNLSPDGLVLFFVSDRDRSGDDRAWMTKRRTVNDPWEPPVPLPEPMYSMGVGCVSADGSMFYSGMSQVPILPVVDFTGDGKVDIEDLLILIEHWGQNEPSFDMGPMPWGDGVVDVDDLEVLMSYWGQALDDPHLLAHWKLDETGGDIAYDSAVENDAVVMGGALWLPDGGQIGGAIQLDGVDDYIDAPYVLDPADGPLSVFAWIKGGAPGQVVLSQEDGANWLLTDTQGCIMTALISEGRRPGDPLYSETVITDGNWHRIGFIWDREYRNLYVDDELVATDVDPQNNFPSSQGELTIGAAHDRHSGTFFSGLIDDVRVYDRVVAP